jgi:hypothetical protein
MASDFDEKKGLHPINFAGVLPASPVFQCGKASIPGKNAGKILLSHEDIQFVADKNQSYNNQDHPGNLIDIF